MSNSSALNPRWATWRFEQIAEQISERAEPTPSDSELYIGLEHMDADSLRIRRWGSQTDLIGTKFRIRKGDILFARRNAYLKRVAIAPHDGLFSAHGMVLRPKHETVLAQFLPIYMQSDMFMDRAIEISVGSLSPTINWKTLAAQEFALPPKDEQLRIVQAMTAFDECIDASLSLQTQSQAVLRSLLDRMWSTFPRRKIGELVETGQIAPPQDGNHGEKHPKASDYVPDGIPFVMASDLRAGEVDFAGCKRIPVALARGLRIGFAKSGDVLLSHKGTVGEVARLGQLTTEFVMLTPQVTYYRARSKVAPDWLYFAFQAPGFKRLLEQYGRQSTRAYVGITTQRELSIPVAEGHDQSQTLSELIEAEKVGTAAGQRARSAAELRRHMLVQALS